MPPVPKRSCRRCVRLGEPPVCSGQAAPRFELGVKRPWLPRQTQRFQPVAESNSAIVASMRTLPPLKALRAFEAAARHMSFKAAAEELALTPTAISHQVRLLENVLGCTLFRRRPRPLALTSVGAALFPVVRNGCESIAEAFPTMRSGAALEAVQV